MYLLFLSRLNTNIGTSALFVTAPALWNVVPVNNNNLYCKSLEYKLRSEAHQYKGVDQS